MATTNNGKKNDGPPDGSTVSRKKVEMSKAQCTSCFLLGHRSNMKACQNYKKNPKRKSAEIAIQGVPQPIATSKKSAKKNPPHKKKGTDVIIDLTSKRSMYLYFFLIWKQQIFREITTKL